MDLLAELMQVQGALVVLVGLVEIGVKAAQQEVRVDLDLVEIIPEGLQEVVGQQVVLRDSI